MPSYESGNLDDIFAQLASEKQTKKQSHKQSHRQQPEQQLTILERNNEIVSSDMPNAEKVRAIEGLIEEVRAEVSRKLALLEQIRQGESVGSYQVGDKAGMRTKYENGTILACVDTDEWDEITIGELLTDSEWQDKGLKYSVNADRIPLDVCQQYIEYWSEVELRQLEEDRLRAELGMDEKANTFTRNIAAREIFDRQQKIEHFGQKVEIMVKNFIEKLAIDHGFEVQVEFGDLIFDYEYKIDLVVTIQDRRRGVIIEDSPHSETVGIQLTILTQEDMLAEKESKAENTWKRLLRQGVVDDVAFVSLDAPTSGAMKAVYNEWLTVKSPGGPDKLLPMATKEALFRAIFKKMLPEEQIDQIWMRCEAEMMA